MVLGISNLGLQSPPPNQRSAPRPFHVCQRTHYGRVTGRSSFYSPLQLSSLKFIVSSRLDANATTDSVSRTRARLCALVYALHRGINTIHPRVQFKCELFQSETRRRASPTNGEFIDFSIRVRFIIKQWRVRRARVSAVDFES